MSQTQTTPKFKKCLLVSRHNLLPTQQEDVQKICNIIDTTPELPTDPQQLKQKIENYDAVVGVLPVPLMVQIIQLRKAMVVFAMESAGTTDTKEEAERLMSQYPGRAVLLPPSKEGEKYRVTVYKGLKAIKEIKIVDEWITQY